MIRAVVWKELREQGLIALTLLVLGAGILVATALFADPPAASASPSDVLRYLGAGRLATLLLAVTAGTVCGGALFAAEREAGTIGFLESLPASRADLWSAKMVAGTGLAVGQIAVVLGTAAALGLLRTGGEVAAFGMQALLAFAWGSFGSAIARTTLGAVGVAIPVATLSACAYLLPILLFFPNPTTHLPNALGAVLFLALMFATPVVLSATAFTRSDRERAGVAAPPPLAARADPADPAPPAPPRSGRPHVGLKALAWLTANQLALPGAVLTAFAAAVGLALLTPAVPPLLFWLPVSLAAGVLGGVTAFGTEQAAGTGRYWGEQRLPVGRVWAFKVAAHLVFTVWLLAVLALPSVVRAQAGDAPGGPVHGQTVLSGVFRSLLLDELGTQSWKLLFLPAAYGFAAGHLCGLLFRKLVVGAGVAALAGGTLAALWVPTLLTGGAWHWQVWVPPVALLLTARLVIRAWTADRLAARGPVLALAGGGAAAGLLLAAGIGYRVVEVPDDPDAEADIRFVDEELPPVDGLAGRPNPGREFRTAAERFARLAERVTPEADRAPAGTVRPETYEDRVVTQVARRGWPVADRVYADPRGGWEAVPEDGDPVLARWLNAVFDPAAPDEGRWVETAAAAAALPVGIYEHPKLIGTNYNPQALFNARHMGAALIARGLQRQFAGDPAAFPGHLRLTLALAANVRNDSVLLAWREGVELERTALSGTGQWLARLPAGRPDLLRPALAAVAAAETPGPFDPRRHLLAERYVLRERQKAPSAWLPDRLTPPGGNKEAPNPEVDLVAFAWTVPWERERTRRLLGLGFEAGFDPAARREVFALVRGRPGVNDLRARANLAPEMAGRDRDLRLLRRFVTLSLAVRLHLDETGRVPQGLPELVAAGYLSALPADPFDEAGGPLRYRLSAGDEALAVGMRGPGDRGGRPPPGVPLRPGQPVLWSVGANHTDEGGRDLGPPGPGRRSDDIALAVPLPAAEPTWTVPAHSHPVEVP